MSNGVSHPLTDDHYTTLLQMLRPNRSFVLKLDADETPMAVTERLHAVARMLDLALTITPIGPASLKLVRGTSTYADPDTIVISPKQHVRFWQHVERRAPDACWAWLGQWSSNQRVGLFLLHGHAYVAHRVAYTLTYGPIPPYEHLRHTCSSACCCNPAHMRRPHVAVDPIAVGDVGEATTQPMVYRSRSTDRQALFWTFTDRGDPETCWAWRGPVDTSGTARFFFAGRKWDVRRLAYELVIGPLPRGSRLRACPHLKRCVTPWHQRVVPASPGDDEQGSPNHLSGSSEDDALP